VSGCYNKLPTRQLDRVAAVEFQYNDKKHIATGKTPFKLNFGRNP